MAPIGRGWHSRSVVTEAPLVNSAIDETPRAVSAQCGGGTDGAVTVDEWTMLWRLLLAAACGGAVGFEREAGGQDAGLRTHVLVALGAALFGLVSVAGFDDHVRPASATNVQVDVTRVASYVAAGVGFIGGGAILKHRTGISGLTTAGSLWVAAAAGLACGVGLWLPPLFAVGIALLALVVLKPVSRWLSGRWEQ